MWSTFVTSVNYQARLAADNEFNIQNRWKKRGISIAANKYGLTWQAGYFGSLVSISALDGTVTVSTAGIEVGQGLNTKVAQAAAYFLGIPLTNISVVSSDSFITPNGQATGSSITSEVCCMAVQNACSMLNTRLTAVRQTMSNPTWQELVAQCYNLGVDLSASGWGSPPQSPTPFNYQSYGMVASEVEIDVLTGEVQILQVDILNDCGIRYHYDTH